MPPEQRHVYVQVVEGLLQHGLRGQVSPRLRERLRQAGVDLDRPLLPLYPVPLWTRCLNIIVEETYPGLTREEAFRRLARAHVEGYGATLLGRAVMSVMRLLGPKRVAQRLPEVLRGTDNYTEAVLSERGPAHYELRINSVVDAPGYAEALFEAVLQVGGAQAPRVMKLREEADGTVYSLTWTER
ncbi:DUF2378 family protein [Corallococcus praedator]|uniref:DUF2378 family protein n=1 Tax=Corallococcus praedator TaxID=2316724 RepID=A0ABX9Q6X2_9BACT|nr:DUF2378 family protein [Corallococcus sp. CA047B]RKH24970.1 DUF2378 family protein [Corallococcus sp. CA031C]RKH92351.1 DUF2378 family protein [Corallococcus praedator]